MKDDEREGHKRVINGREKKRMMKGREKRQRQRTQINLEDSGKERRGKQQKKI